MRRLLTLPLVLILGCESVGSAYNAMGPGTKAAIMVLVALATFVAAKYSLPQKIVQPL